jgi:hypothetical protein
MHEVLERRRPEGSLFDECLDNLRMDVVNDALVTGPQKAPHHVGSHPTQSDHAQFHAVSLLLQDGYARFNLANMNKASGRHGYPADITLPIAPHERLQSCFGAERHHQLGFKVLQRLQDWLSKIGQFAAA